MRNFAELMQQNVGSHSDATPSRKECAPPNSGPKPLLILYFDGALATTGIPNNNLAEIGL
ncbi:MAG: hypothetical protein DYG96_07245 [Chlorobi bacterium CHB2]|nr:hypothetical protein [Chlorobi bacterium CHB2]